MDLPLDFQPGINFSNRVRLSVGAPISSATDPARNGFLLLVSFSRNRFHLTDDSVAIYVQSILEGFAKDFATSLVEQQIFSFSVSCKQVGFLVLELISVASEHFKLGFFLYNGTGILRARTFAKSDSGIVHSWQEVRPRSSKRSFAEVVKSSRSPLSSTNIVPIGIHTTGCGSRGVKTSGFRPCTSVFQRFGSRSSSSSSERARPSDSHRGRLRTLVFERLFLFNCKTLGFSAFEF